MLGPYSAILKIFGDRPCFERGELGPDRWGWVGGDHKFITYFGGVGDWLNDK